MQKRRKLSQFLNQLKSASQLPGKQVTALERCQEHKLAPEAPVRIRELQHLGPMETWFERCGSSGPLKLIWSGGVDPWLVQCRE